VLSGFGAPPAANQFTGGSDGQWTGQGDTYGGGSMYPDEESWQGKGGMSMNQGALHGSDSAYGNGRNVTYGDEQAHERDMSRRDGVLAQPPAEQSTAGGIMDGPVDQEGSGDAGSAMGRMQKVGDRWVFVRTAAPP